VGLVLCNAPIAKASADAALPDAIGLAVIFAGIARVKKIDAMATHNHDAKHGGNCGVWVGRSPRASRASG
jgi:hypothetical protein